MASRKSSSSSSSSSESERVSIRDRQVSETSRDTSATTSHQQQRSSTHTSDRTSNAETRTIHTASPSVSHASVSLSTTQQVNQPIPLAPPAQLVGEVPIIQPPVSNGTGVGVFGPQHPPGYPIQPPVNTINIDVAAAQQQYQQRADVSQQQFSTSSLTSSSSATSFNSPGSTTVTQLLGPPVLQPHPQQRFDVAKAIFNQVDTNKDGSISREEFRQWAQGGAAGQTHHFHQQQQHAQFANQIPPEHIYNELLGPDAFKDVILDIDYGALGSFNVPFQTADQFSGEQLPPGIRVRPAYTAVDSLNYQQHMFNTPRTIHAGNGSNSYDYSGAGNQNYHYQDVAAQPPFDVAKAIFNQVDVNHDGSITRDEFRQWAQGGVGHSNQFNHSTVLDGGNPNVAQILQQSGLGQVLPH